MSDFRIVRDYQQSPVQVWRVLTDPELIVECEVLEVNAPSLLRYSWAGDEGGDVTQVAYRLEPHAGGTRFTYEHTGFTGVGGLFMAKLLGRVRRKMLTVGLPAVLALLSDDGLA
ncbi:MAG TPA: SRPBCC domain-containing protein [Streptosporangiaceae bacterium]|jgi:uncharacterized protein YndB with AHSA1/START domain